jgi:TetR/AcrR family transcriptional regulator, transcriptional repressor for nem operon
MPMDDTKNKIMDLAENLLLSRGYNGFSYKNISLALGIKNAAIHYHYPAKKDLGVAVIRRARHQLKTWIQFMSEQKTPFGDVLDQLFGRYIQFMNSGNKICLGGALETDFHTLPLEVQQETRAYVSEVIQWMKTMFSEGREQGAFSFPGNPEDKALQVLSSLQGAVQKVRTTDESSLYSVMNQIKIELGV